MDIVAAKAALREDMRRRLDALKPARQAVEEDVVSAAVQAEPAWTSARTVAVYKAVGKELSAVGLANGAWRQGKRVLFPRVDGPRLAWHAVDTWSRLRPGAFGIPEPDPALPEVAPEQVDLWLVPGLAFTPDGRRLGQGGGFYDRALESRKDGAPVWGLAFDLQVLDDLPTEPHDVGLDRVLAAKLVGVDLGPPHT